MVKSIGLSYFLAAFALPLAAIAQSGDAKILTGHVAVTLSKTGRTAAVLVKKDASSKDVDSLFCIDLVPPAPATLVFAGPARVIYRPLPITGVPAGIKISGPENVASTLTVVSTAGEGWSFVAKGQKPLTAKDQGAAKLSTINVSIVRRVDWIGDDGQRRGTDLEGCLAPAGEEAP